jgi:hypothetical protein
MAMATPTLRKTLFCLAIFSAAFMSFLIEPLIGKLATPKLGSAAAVWSVILMFFQIALLLGYTLTYGLSKLPEKMQAGIYILLVCTSLFFLRFPTELEWQHINLADPTIGLVLVLFASIGLPVVALYTVSGTIQHYCGISGWRNPYVLFSLSNLACLSSLLAFPFLIEPNFSLSSICSGWIVGSASALALTCLASASVYKMLNKVTRTSNDRPDEAEPTPPAVSQEERQTLSLSSFLICTALSALGCITLISYTAYVTADVAPVPLLWIVPLCIYLSTFIICFKDNTYYNREFFALVSPALWIIEPLLKTNAIANLALVMAVVLCFCMMFHGELALRKPHHKHLTAYYLAIAIGGAVGGIFENFVAPAIFSSNMEIGLLGVCVVALSAFTLFRRCASINKVWVSLTYAGITIVMASVVGLEFYLRFVYSPDTLLLSRNFYGCLKVVKSRFPDASERIVLIHGNTTHGSQFTDEARKDVPTTYYSKTTACGAVFPALRKLHGDKALNVGIIGLGAGTLATYGQNQDKFTFYEIDGRVETIARKYFTYLDRSHAKINVLTGDARKTMEQQPAQAYDLLIIDAFCGDSVPTHLLTREAFQIYCKHLKPDGVMLFHCSNRYLNLPAVIANVADSFSLPGLIIAGKEAIYTVVCRQTSMEAPIIQSAHYINPDLTTQRVSPSKQIGVWTDDYVSLLPVMKYDSK